MVSPIPNTVPRTSTFTRHVISHNYFQMKQITGRKIITSAAPTDVFVLDFDGVIADSAYEVNSAGLLAASARWGNQISPTDSSRILQGLSKTRPRLVRGYESMVMARLIAESNDNIHQILKDTWASSGGLLEQSLAAWQEDPEELNTLFEKLRSERIQNDENAWLNLVPLYDGMAEALSDCPYPWYIASSKRGDRLLKLLNASPLNLQLSEDSPRVFSGLIPPNEKKIEALQSILARPIASSPSTELHFIDDRFETIAAIAHEPSLQRYNLYLADWGYNVQEERNEVKNLPRNVRILSLSQCCELLRFGIIMEVNDGCQDTDEEALQGVYTPFNNNNSN